MLIAVFFMVLVIGMIGMTISEKKAKLFWIGFPSMLITFVCSLALIVSGAIIFINQLGKDGDIASMQSKYDSLAYQYANEIYSNDIAKRDLMADIEKWNANLARNQKDQHDFWIGVFIPDIYDQFEFIELDGGV